MWKKEEFYLITYSAKC